MYDLINIFEIFLPQLLLYPNPTDPLNPEAAQMQLKYEEKYKEKIKEYVAKYAQLGQVDIGFPKPDIPQDKKSCSKSSNNGTPNKNGTIHSSNTRST